jgi:hypothetical protein
MRFSTYSLRIILVLCLRSKDYADLFFAIL